MWKFTSFTENKIPLANNKVILYFYEMLLFINSTWHQIQICSWLFIMDIAPWTNYICNGPLWFLYICNMFFTYIVHFFFKWLYGYIFFRSLSRELVRILDADGIERRKGRRLRRRKYISRVTYHLKKEKFSSYL